MCFQFFVSASIYKLFVAYNVYKKIDAGAITYDQTLGESVDYQTVESCLNRMITISDNDCGVALGSLVGWSKIDALSQEEGYTQPTLITTKPMERFIKTKRRLPLTWLYCFIAYTPVTSLLNHQQIIS